jgi:hypothetical protein
MPNLTCNDDILISCLGIGSQLDGLGHIGDARGMYYNCHEGREISDLGGLSRLGVHQIPPLVARGVVLDTAGHKGAVQMMINPVALR